jgi:hypothetical protein
VPRQTALADTARTGEGHQSAGGETGCDLGQVDFPSGQRIARQSNPGWSRRMVAEDRMLVGRSSGEGSKPTSSAIPPEHVAYAIGDWAGPWFVGADRLGVTA